MGYNTFISRMLGAQLAVILSLTSPAVAETVVVGFSNFPPFITASDKGDPTGYLPDLLKKIASAEGIKLEYRQFANPGASMAALANGEITVIPNLAPTDERREVGWFTATTGWVEFGLFALRDRAAALGGTWPDDLRLGYVSGAFTENLAQDFTKATRIGYETNEEMLVALSSGEIDGGIFFVYTIKNLSQLLGISDRFAQVGPPIRRIPSSFVFANTEGAMFNRFEQQVERLLRSGEIRALAAQWLGEAAPRLLNPGTNRLILLGICLMALTSGLFVGAVWIRARNKLLRVAVGQAAQQKDFATRLKQLNEELHDRNTEMEKLLYVVSHDLKSPLVSIAGFAGRISKSLEKGRSTDAQRSLERVSRNVDTMNALIDGILQTSRIGRLQPRFVDVSLQSMVADVSSALFAETEAVGAAVHLETDLAFVTDRQMMVQMLQNLVANALRHGCPNPGMSITIRVQNIDNVVQIGVQDHGPGIAPEFQERIFEMYQKLPHSAAGTGLGLAIVRQTAIALGGDAWVETNTGEGATFWVRLPQKSPEHQADRSAA